MTTCGTPDLARLARTVGARMSGENFPVALRVLPREVRSQLSAVYGFARFVDEVGDAHDLPSERRLALLDEIDADIDRLPDARLDPVRGLAEMVADATVPRPPLHDLVAANRLDQQRPVHETFGELMHYCSLSAAPVGRIVLHLAAAATPERIGWSDDVCAALQVLEHCQDVREDALAGRVYLPATSLRAQRVSRDDLVAERATPALRAVVQQQVLRSRDLLEAGRPLVRSLHGWARVAVAGFVAGGLATADALEAASHDVLATDVRPSKQRTARHALRLAVAR
ncbi:squalene synthase HpnC [Jatrophihabitans fulvus]